MKSKVTARKKPPITAENSWPIVLTIGHSTRSLDDFVQLLKTHGVACVVDVRTVPRSRHNPQFDKILLPSSLRNSGIDYVHLPGLGGLRHSRVDSANVGWRNLSFRGYADYMRTAEFEVNLRTLLEIARRTQVVLMCAEAVPWRCHRSLIADALLTHGVRTEDIMSSSRRQVHTLTPFAKVCGTTVTYPQESKATRLKEPRKVFRQKGVPKRTRTVGKDLFKK
jgi:uncharacterized protein (DUF488 family)